MDLKLFNIESAFKYGDNNNMTQFDIHEFFPFNVLWYQLGPRNEIGNYWVQAVTTEQVKEEYVNENREYNDDDYEYYYEDEEYVGE